MVYDMTMTRCFMLSALAMLCVYNNMSKYKMFLKKECSWNGPFYENNFIKTILCGPPSLWLGLVEVQLLTSRSLRSLPNPSAVRGACRRCPLRWRDDSLFLLHSHAMYWAWHTRAPSKILLPLSCPPPPPPPWIFYFKMPLGARSSAQRKKLPSASAACPSVSYKEPERTARGQNIFIDLETSFRCPLSPLGSAQALSSFIKRRLPL